MRVMLINPPIDCVLEEGRKSGHAVLILQLCTIGHFVYSSLA